MDAWTFNRFGEPNEVLVRSRVPVPVADPKTQVLVRVSAATVNFADAVIIRGQYQFRPELPAVPGIELCGRIVRNAGGASPLRVGDRVAGMSFGLVGAFAEYAVMDLSDALTVPDSFDDIEASAFSVAYQTAWFALHVRAQLRPGETILVHSAAGGVGSAAVQLAKAHGARVIGVVGSGSKVATAKALGCDHVLLRTDADFVGHIRGLTGRAGVDVVVDSVGGDAHRISARSVAFEGRIVLVGFASGEPSQLSAEHALVKNYTVMGLHWGLYRTHRHDLVASSYEQLCRTVTRHGIRPLVSRVVDFADAPAAFSAVAEGSSTGRVVVSSG